MRSSRPSRRASATSAGRTVDRRWSHSARVAEELGDLDQQAADEPVVFGRIALDERRVIGDAIALPVALIRPLQATDDGGRLVGREVDPAAFADPLEQAGERVGIAGRRAARSGLDRGRPAMPADRPRDRPVASTSDGETEAGIEGNTAVARVLDDHGAAGPLDVPRPGRSVRPGAGQDDRDERARRRLFGRAREQQIDRWRDRAARPAAAGRLPPTISTSRFERDHVDVAVVAARPSPSTTRIGRRRVAFEDLGEVARSARVEVLGDDDRRHVAPGRSATTRDRASIPRPTSR